jgi:hypothetical protein
MQASGVSRCSAVQCSGAVLRYSALTSPTALHCFMFASAGRILAHGMGLWPNSALFSQASLKHTKLSSSSNEGKETLAKVATNFRRPLRHM